jgi:membrane fusion protein (multidrug efflux system)
MERSVLVRISLLILCALIGAAPGCSNEGSGNAAQPRPAVEVGFVVLETESVTISRELAGRTSAYQSSEVRPQVDGIIESREFDEGSEVRAGQALYRIDAARYRAARDEARAALASARAAVAAQESKADRYRSLVETEAVSKQEAEDAIASARQAKAAVAQAAAALKTAEINLGYTTIKAPISGRIGRSLVTPGALVTANQSQLLATIQQLDPINVDITQSSSELLELRRALAAGAALPVSAETTLLLEDGLAYPHEGKLEFAEAMVDESTGSVTLRAVFPNPEGTLLPGMFVRAQAPQARLPEAILAPQQGITRDPTGSAVAMVVAEGDVVERRDVKTGQAIGDKWLIVSGLESGDRLIVEGLGKIRPGASVKPVAVDLSRSE